MSNNNIKKLTLYCLDCVKATGKNAAFNNLRGNKENKVIITNDFVFESDNKEIIDILTKYALNKSTMSLFYGSLFIEGEKNKNKYYSPLLFTECELIREGDKITLNYDKDSMSINISVISSLLDNNDSDIIENVINTLLNIDEPLNIDLKKVLSGLINLDGLTITENQNAIILTKTPESVAGLVNELKTIAELY